jgi:hypothetical protein
MIEPPWCGIGRELVMERSILRVGWACGVGPHLLSPRLGAGPGRSDGGLTAGALGREQPPRLMAAG